MVAAGAVVVCLAAIAIVLFAKYQSASSSVVPASITQQVKSPIYIPRKLPGKYRIDQNSFTYSEGDDVLMFQASDGVGSNLVFSEQPKPKDFNFEQFYKTQMESPRTINDVPYPSVWSKISGGRVTLSIVTDDIWVIMTTTAPLGDSEMQRIAQGIKKN